jgi:beta-galactosidase/beta-glucuronidase
MRHQRSLAGTWDFQLDPRGDLTVESLSPDRTIHVPLPWQAAFPELQAYSGYAWYRCRVDLTDEWFDGEVLLHFGAVDYWSQVFVNGQLAGEHEGGYTPFTLPIERYLKSGANELAVRVYDAAQSQLLISRWPNEAHASEAHRPPYDPSQLLHGKQEWYVNVGGIWQDVTLTAVPAIYIASVRVTPHISTGMAHVVVELGGCSTSATEGELTVSVRDVDGRTWDAHTPLVGAREYQTCVTVPAPRLWSTDEPNLYTAVVKLHTPSGDDCADARFGFREIATRDGQLVLNGEPIYLLAVLDQDLYPDTVYTVPSEDFLRDQFAKARELGFNCLRCHIKPPDPRYLDLADELGILVWAEVPSWRTLYVKRTLDADVLTLDDSIKRQVEHTLEAMIRRDFNHPSLVIWTIVNEDWGTLLPLSAADRAWVAEMYDRCKQLDPTRLVVDNSACAAPWGPNIHVKSDLDDFHMYAAIPDQATSFEQAIEQFSLRPLWTYSAQGDARRTGQEPLVLSEFGNWGLPSPRLLRPHYAGDPPWFSLGPWWSGWEGEAGWPAGATERFTEYGLDAIWPDFEAFATATQWHQFAALKFEIEVLRRQPAIAGYVVTELADAYWESNGLLDFLRNPKAYHDLFASINTLDMIVPQTRRYAYWDDQQVAVRVHGAHYSRATGLARA